MGDSKLNRIMNDKFYKQLIIEKGVKYALEAGWYNDFYALNGGEPDYLLNLNITPIEDVIKFQNQSKPIAVLVTSGSFNPPHRGHVESMRQAEAYMESLGYNVVSYFSPSHDMYVSKKKGDKHIPAAERVELLSKMGVNVCPWESMFLEGDVIFTDVVLRLHQLLTIKHSLRVDKMLFVCGSDISQYVRPFELNEDIGALLIKRPGYENEFYIEKTRVEMFSEKDRIFFLDSKDPIKESSTNILSSGLFNQDTLKKKATLRMREGNEFDQEILKIVSDYFDEVTTYIIKNNAVVRDYVDKTILPHAKTISMDKFTKGDVNYVHSRIYDYFGMNCIGFDEELKDEVPEGFYILFDDDSASGYMMGRVAEKLERTHGIVVMLHQTQIPHNVEFEIIDAYDFDFGCKDGGLKVRDSGRLPYIMPYVNPTSRCNVKRPFEFSSRIIDLNKKFGNRVEEDVTSLINYLEKIESKYKK